MLNADREVLLVAAATGRRQARLAAEPYAGPQGVECSPDGRFVARTYADGFVTVWDVAARARLGSLKIREGKEPFRVALDAGAQRLVAWIGDRLLVFPRSTWTDPARIAPQGPTQPATSFDIGSRPIHATTWRRSLAVSADGRNLAAAGVAATGGILPRSTLTLVDLETTRVTPIPSAYGLEVAFSPDGRRLAILGIRGIDLWDIAAGAFVAYPAR